MSHSCCSNSGSSQSEICNVLFDICFKKRFAQMVNCADNVSMALKIQIKSQRNTNHVADSCKNSQKRKLKLKISFSMRPVGHFCYRVSTCTRACELDITCFCCNKVLSRCSRNPLANKHCSKSIREQRISSGKPLTNTWVRQGANTVLSTDQKYQDAPGMWPHKRTREEQCHCAVLTITNPTQTWTGRSVFERRCG